MTSKSDSKNRDGVLRRQAGKIVVENAAGAHKKMEALTPEVGRSLLHELRVQRVELEAQNEELRRTQEELQASRERYFELYDMAPVGYFSISKAGIILEANLTAASMLGVAPRDLRAQRFSSLIFKADQDIYYLHRNLLLKTQASQVYEARMVCRDGSLFWARVEVVLAQDGKTGSPSCRTTISDITAHKQMEDALGQEKEVLQTILDNIPVMIAHIDREGNHQWVNRCWQSTLGWSLMEVLQTDILAEIYPDPDYRKYVIDFIAAHSSTWGDFRIRARNGQLLDSAWINVPLAGGSNLGIGVDITERKQAEAKLAKSYESLKKNLEDAIDTMVKIVEMRDPYTAGHQQRVARLAVAIAREMKLEDARIDQLRIAAVIHDIGKMNVPSDILSKPGRLSEIEFGLIKSHSQNGYDIVKGMDFPCAVAQAILQHHERLDGSGYPNRIKGEDMLPEAKILAVADVIEAMYSYRPYRPAMGIDIALEEISNGRGKLYDIGVVDACLRVFNNGKFDFEDV